MGYLAVKLIMIVGLLWIISPITVSAQAQMIKGCIKPNGVLKIIDYDASCSASQTEIFINTAGEPGPQGPAGPKGDIGPAGPEGSIGSQGPAGPQGVAGAQGFQGPAGAKGDQGLAGAKGDTGAQGLPGPAGAKGDQGLAGAKGDTGAQGLPGPAGAKGDTGPIGPAGPSGSGSLEYVYVGNTEATFTQFDWNRGSNSWSACQAEFGPDARLATSVEVAGGSVPNTAPDGAVVNLVFVGGAALGSSFLRVDAVLGATPYDNSVGHVMFGSSALNTPLGLNTFSSPYACSTPRT